MALGDDKIKDLFSSKLSGFEPELPASVWGGIDQLLSQQAPVTPDASQTQAASTATKASALKTGLIAAGVAATIAAGVFIAYEPSVAEAPEIELETPKEIVQEALPSIVEELDEEATTIFARTITMREVSATEHKPDVEIEEVVEVEKEQEETAETEVKVLGLDAEEALPIAAIIPKFLKKDMSLSLKVNGGALSSNVNQRGGGLLFSKDTRSTEFADILKDENKDYKLSHKQPIAVGLTVSKQLSRQFSLETGLMFTYLSSKISTNSAIDIKEEQVFGYLGIPIFLNYNFYEWEKAKFYISLGTMIQKDVYGRYTSKLVYGDGIYPTLNGEAYTILYSEPAYIRKNISQSNWQFSGHLGLGASYPIYQKLRIQTSIGGAYYFDANNEYRTIYSDRKFQLDLNLGLKFDF